MRTEAQARTRREGGRAKRFGRKGLQGDERSTYCQLKRNQTSTGRRRKDCRCHDGRYLACDSFLKIPNTLPPNLGIDTQTMSASNCPTTV